MNELVRVVQRALPTASACLLPPQSDRPLAYLTCVRPAWEKHFASLNIDRKMSNFVQYLFLLELKLITVE